MRSTLNLGRPRVEYRFDSRSNGFRWLTIDTFYPPSGTLSRIRNRPVRFPEETRAVILSAAFALQKRRDARYSTTFHRYYYRYIARGMEAEGGGARCIELKRSLVNRERILRHNRPSPTRRSGSCLSRR